MSKYSFEFKKHVVNAYLNGEGGMQFLCRKYGIRSDYDIRKWVANYKAWGDKGLVPSTKNTFYSFEKKLSAVELYLSTELSSMEVALQEGITTPGLICKWANTFRAKGPDGLRKKKERTDTVTPHQKKSQMSDGSIMDTNSERIKQLEDELLKLRIENAYLKELRRLRLEEETLQRKQRGLSTVSGENSN